MPLFSIVIPTYNRSGQIVHAIESLLRQTFNSYEIIVVDDGSSDDTKEKLSGYITSGTIYYHHQENKGVCAARNHGASKAKGSYLIFLDSDDEVLPEWLADFKNLSDQGFSLLCCSMTVRKPGGGIKKVSCLDPYKNGGKDKGISIPGTWAIKTDWFRSLGGFDEVIKYGENTELKFRMMAEDKNWGFLDHHNLIYNESETGGSKQIKNKLQSNLHILAKHQHYFNQNPEVKRLFLSVAAVSAARLGMYDEARRLFFLTWKTRKTNLKSILQCMISMHPLLMRRKWKPISSNIQ